MVCYGGRGEGKAYFHLEGLGKNGIFNWKMGTGHKYGLKYMEEHMARYE